MPESSRFMEAEASRTSQMPESSRFTEAEAVYGASSKRTINASDPSYGAASSDLTAVDTSLPSGPKPVGIFVSTMEIQVLYASGTNPFAYNQFLLEKLRDAGAPVEGAIHLRLAHGQLFKLKTNPVNPEDGFRYLWLPENYSYALQQAGGVH
jgi:hypothetical protein